MEGFEWDEDKRQQNISRHGVDFLRIVRIFEGETVEAEDERNDYGERRIRALGHVGQDCFIVIYTWRGGNRRIISAWKVGENGKRRYQALHTRRN